VNSDARQTARSRSGEEEQTQRLADPLSIAADVPAPPLREVEEHVWAVQSEQDIRRFLRSQAGL